MGKTFCKKTQPSMLTHLNVYFLMIVDHIAKSTVLRQEFSNQISQTYAHTFILYTHPPASHTHILTLSHTHKHTHTIIWLLSLSLSLTHSIVIIGKGTRPYEKWCMIKIPLFWAKKMCSYILYIWVMDCSLGGYRTCWALVRGALGIRDVNSDRASLTSHT